MDSPPDPEPMSVNLNVSRGPLKYGAIGFLYGLGSHNIPCLNILAPLKAQVAAQKPEGGLQHPNGDALSVSDTYRAAGGREIEIYLQDCYAHWPYEQFGMADFLTKVEGVMRQVMDSPNRAMFSYVPFNEPDQIWYNKTDRKLDLFADWKTVVCKIKTIDPAARVVGPNFARYDSGVYREFLAFAQANDCLPEVISWHELNDDFFSGWYQRYEDYRTLERSLGIAPREICINEYGRKAGDLSVPGKLIQWIARLEDSKVDACLAYWTDAGSLNNLVTPDHYNRPTGAWWLYRWYSEMSGSTVEVIPPDRNAEGLQGLASFDGAQREARILLGGGSRPIWLAVNGLETACFGNRVRVRVWEIPASGIRPSDGPMLIQEADLPLRGDSLTLALGPGAASSAYQVLLSAAPEPPTVSPLDAGLVVSAGQNGYYDLRLRCAASLWGCAPGVWKIAMALDGAPLTELAIPPAGRGIWTDVALQVFLAAGIHRVTFHPAAPDAGEAVSIQALGVTPSGRPVRSYEAEAPENTLSGSAAVLEDAAASGGRCVGGIGNGAGNALIFNHLHVAVGGVYRLVVYFANAEFRGGHSYNSQVVDRYAEIGVNDGAPQKVYFRNTFDWHNYQSCALDVALRAGANTIRFSNSAPGAYAPHIDRIEIAAPLLDETSG